VSWESPALGVRRGGAGPESQLGDFGPLAGRKSYAMRLMLPGCGFRVAPGSGRLAGVVLLGAVLPGSGAGSVAEGP